MKTMLLFIFACAISVVFTQQPTPSYDGVYIDKYISLSDYSKDPLTTIRQHFGQNTRMGDISRSDDGIVQEIWNGENMFVFQNNELSRFYISEGNSILYLNGKYLLKLDDTMNDILRNAPKDVTMSIFKKQTYYIHIPMHDDIYTVNFNDQWKVVGFLGNVAM